jgi:hypothetical protein
MIPFFFAHERKRKLDGETMQDLNCKPCIFIVKNFIETIHMLQKPKTSNPRGKSSRFLNRISCGHLFFFGNLAAQQFYS